MIVLNNYLTHEDAEFNFNIKWRGFTRYDKITGKSEARGSKL